MRYLLLFMLSSVVYAGPYIEGGIGVPLSPETGYMQDGYGILGFGYRHPIDHRLSFQLGFEHRSDTGTDTCGIKRCNGDNAVEGVVRFEW